MLKKISLSKVVKILVVYPVMLLLLLAQANFTLAAGRLKTNGNGTVTDLATGLIWQQQDDNITRTQAAAKSECIGLTLGGNSNWRLPSIKELSSIVDERVDNPSIDDAAFPNTDSSRYWSASSVAGSTSSAWGVFFGSGFVGSDGTGNSRYVRCVR